MLFRPGPGGFFQISGTVTFAHHGFCHRFAIRSVGRHTDAKGKRRVTIPGGVVVPALELYAIVLQHLIGVFFLKRVFGHSFHILAVICTGNREEIRRFLGRSLVFRIHHWEAVSKVGGVERL